MSGDVQPRKRKDKKKKKDELGLEEPRGTAAALGEGDVFIHSHHEHSTGGHWCAKIIFFSLLAVLITLIGLIILENRGLSELEANAVESRYSGVLEGWIEDVPDDDHHDEHTLELKHPVEENESDDDDDDDEIVEKLEREISDEDIISGEVSKMAEMDQDDDDDDAASKEQEGQEGDEQDGDEADNDEPPVERITIPPAGKPYTEIEEEPLQSTPDTLAAEEEYERQQEELRREREAQSSQGMWLKLVVGGALLVATHAVVRRATARRDEPDTEPIAREDPPIIDRRMTLIPQNVEPEPIIPPIQEEIVPKITKSVQSAPVVKPQFQDDSESLKNVEEEIQEYDKDLDKEKELYSDEEEEEEEEIDEEEEEEDIVKEEVIPKKVEMKETKSAVVNKAPVEEEPEEESEDVEIIDEEQIEEELEEEEDEVEEEISDVDDTELLSRLEAKYGRLPEPERPGKNKGGGNSIEDDWPGEPSDPYWSQQLDLAEDELRQDWLE